MDNQNNRNKQNLPGNNNPNNKNNRQRWNIILFTVMLISFIVFALYQFREDTDAREITYDQFLNMVDSGEVKKVVIEDDKIVITAKTEAEMKNSKKKGASESDVVEGSVADNNDSSSKDSSDDSTGLFSNVTRKQYYTCLLYTSTAIAGVLNKYKNMFGKARVVVIKSQLGQPIVAYSGEDVYWEIPDDLPKFTKLMIDGKALYIHRANFQIIDKSLLESN